LNAIFSRNFIAKINNSLSVLSGKSTKEVIHDVCEVKKKFQLIIVGDFKVSWIFQGDIGDVHPDDGFSGRNRSSRQQSRLRFTSKQDL
jgi:hypothetical protein